MTQPTFKEYWSKGTISIDIARIFGSNDSFSLSEFFDVERKLLQIAFDVGIFSPSLYPASLSVFCGAEKDTGCKLVVDDEGYLYKCWNYIFDSSKAYAKLNEILKQNREIVEITNVNRLRYVEGASLLNIMRRCLRCKWFAFCQGMCPDMRLRMLEGKEENIYSQGRCQKLVRDYINFLLKLYLKGAGYLETCD